MILVIYFSFEPLMFPLTGLGALVFLFVPKRHQCMAASLADNPKNAGLPEMILITFEKNAGHFSDESRLVS